MEEITTIESNVYGYYPNTLLDSSSGATVGIATSSRAYDCLFARTNYSDGQYYWLGSQYAYPVVDYFGFTFFGMRGASNGGMFNYLLSHSGGYAGSNCRGVRPAVYLKSGIQFEKDADGVWQIS